MHTSSYARGNLFLGTQPKIWYYTAAKRTASHTSPQSDEASLVHSCETRMNHMLISYRNQFQ